MIRIRCGTCSTSQGYKTSNSGELSLPAAEEARLVARGVAVYATRPVMGTLPGVATLGNETAAAPSAQSEEHTGLDAGDTLDIEDGHFTKASLMTMTRGEMEKLAVDLGIDTRKCKNKSEIADLIAEVEVEPGDDEEPPETGVADPVV